MSESGTGSTEDTLHGDVSEPSPGAPIVDTLQDASLPAGPSPHLAALERGASVGRYVLLARVGAGSMGVVHSA